MTKRIQKYEGNVAKNALWALTLIDLKVEFKMVTLSTTGGDNIKSLGLLICHFHINLGSMMVIFLRCTLWFQLEDMFQLIVTPQGIEKVTIQLIDTPTKVYAIGARLFLSKVPLEVLQN